MNAERMKYPRRYQYPSYRQLLIARRKWRVWNKERIERMIK